MEAGGGEVGKAAFLDSEAPISQVMPLTPACRSVGCCSQPKVGKLLSLALVAKKEVKA